MNPSVFFRNLALIYIATGPIYWFFLIPPESFSLIKQGIAATLIGAGAVIGYKEIFAQSGALQKSGSGMIFGIILMSIPSIFFAQPEESFEHLTRYLILLAIILLFYWVMLDRQIPEKLAPVIAYIMIPVCLMTSANWLLDLQIEGYVGPEFILPLHISGFSDNRTGWSNGLAVMALFMLWQYIVAPDRNRLYLLAFASIALAQTACGGRGGMTATAVGVIALLVYHKRYMNMLVITVAIAIFAALNWDFLYEHLRFDRLDETNTTADFTAGRAEQYTLAIALIDDPIRLFIGLGPEGYKEYFAKKFIEYAIHNVWLRLLIEYGIFLLLFAIGYLIKSMIDAYQRDRRSMPLIIILSAGFISTFVEPHAILYSYQNYLLWWILYVAVRMNRTTYLIPAARSK
ncbi:MAG: O-antigen ligase family protein [Pseudomonadota bacterium]